MKVSTKRGGGRPPLRAFVRPEHAERFGTTNFERTRHLEAVVRVKQLQAAGEKHDIALVIVAEAMGTGVRQLQRWHSRFEVIASSEARRERQSAAAVVEGVRLLRAWSALPIALQRVAEEHRTSGEAIVAAVEEQFEAAQALHISMPKWLSRESTRQKLAELFRAT
ncbi:hypothetical protein AB4059_02330 [Lysobacter sp. 2RAF19]